MLKRALRLLPCGASKPSPHHSPAAMSGLLRPALIPTRGSTCSCWTLPSWSCPQWTSGISWCAGLIRWWWVESWPLPKFMCCSPNPPVLECVCICNGVFKEIIQLKWGYWIRWSLIQYDWCHMDTTLLRRGDSDTYTHRRKTMWGPERTRPSKERGLRKNQPADTWISDF